MHLYIELLNFSNSLSGLDLLSKLGLVNIFLGSTYKILIFFPFRYSRSATREPRERPESLNFYKEEISDVSVEDIFQNEQNFDDDANNQLSESNLKDETEVDNNLNDNLIDNSVEVVSMQALEIQDENSQDKLDSENAPDPESALSKENEGRLPTGQLDLKFYHSPLW